MTHITNIIRREQNINLLRPAGMTEAEIATLVPVTGPQLVDRAARSKAEYCTLTHPSQPSVIWRARTFYNDGTVQAETTIETPANATERDARIGLQAGWRHARFGRNGEWANPTMTLERERNNADLRRRAAAEWETLPATINEHADRRDELRMGLERTRMGEE